MLSNVSLRQQAVYVPEEWRNSQNVKELNETTATLVANCAKLGYGFSEELLHVINGLNPLRKLEILEVLKDVTGVKKNWTPMIRQWDIPTGESVLDHIKTWFANALGTQNGTRLPCGHLIPENTFPIERYNGCPFCGTPFEVAELELTPSKNPLKVLKLWGKEDLKAYFQSLLRSPVALDATQADSAKILLKEFGLMEGVEIRMKETLMLVIDVLVEQEDWDTAGKLFKTPNDILRYLWYKKTGFLQLIEPKVIIKRMAKNARNVYTQTDQSAKVKIKTAEDLRLKFTRTQCRMYALWLNGLKMDVTAQCENMHPKRSMWVRVIRALRLAEYSKRPGYEQLKALLDAFYNERYEVWQGRVNHYKLKLDAGKTFSLLKQRPGLFARSLFANMLWFGKETTLEHFREILPQIAPRLVYTLNMYAETYFDRNASRVAKPLGGVSKRLPANKLVQLYSDEALKEMQMAVQEVSLKAIEGYLSKQENENKRIYIDESLFQIPIAIGDRSEMVQDLPQILMGTRLPVEGDTVRLFMQWGEGLAAQHLDMDLSCMVAYESRTERCSYSKLTVAGCQHSGDIQQIPEKVGTAEYIDVNMDHLTKLGAKYVSFTCNAYTNGSLAPNLVVGWMNAAYPMEIKPSGVAYDPTAVQQQCRITQTLNKGMVFGVLDVAAREILWLELAFGGQIVQNLDTQGVEALMAKLDAKWKIGDLLQLKANCQSLTRVEVPEEAEEVYDVEWARDSAKVAELFLG